MIVATRYHDISCGHRVANHESKCAHLHGHNYRITFECAAEELDNFPLLRARSANGWKLIGTIIS